MRMIKSKIAVAVATTAVVALGSTAAYAYFTTTGSGTGEASVGSASDDWTVAVSIDSPTVALFPGGAAQTFSYTVTNASNGNLNLASVVAGVAHDASGNIIDYNTGLPVAGCLATWFTVTNTGDPAGTYAAGGVNHGTGSIALTESNSPQDACQKASPQVVVTAA